MGRRFKIVAVIIVAVMLAVSCGRKDAGGEGRLEEPFQDTSPEPVRLSVAWWGNQVRDERTLQVLNLYARDNPGISFDGYYWEWSNYWDELAAAVAGHTMPDIVQMDYKYLRQYVDKGLLVDLTPYVQDGTLDLSDCNQNLIDTAKVDGGLYSVAAGTSSPALLYNKTLLDENNIRIKDSMNMEEFLALCREVYEKTGYKTNINYRNNEQVIEYLLRAEGIVMYEEGKMGGESAEPYIRYFRLYEDGIKEGWHMAPSVFANRTVSSVEQDPLVYGGEPGERSWCAFNYNSMYVAMKNAAPQDMEIEMALWPSDHPESSNYLKPSLFWGISTDCRDPDEAAKVLDFFTNSVDCNKILLAERGVPVSDKVAEAIEPEFDENTRKTVKFVKELVEPVSSMINPPLPNGASEVNELLNQLEEKVCYGEMTAEEAGRQLYEQGSRILADKSGE